MDAPTAPAPRITGFRRSLLAAVLAGGVVVAGGVAVAVASSHPKQVTVCATRKGLVRAASVRNRCPKHTHKVKVATKGSKGAKGDPGVPGAPGAPGPGAKAFNGVQPVQGPYQTAVTVLGFPVSVFCAGGDSVAVDLLNHSDDTYVISGVLNHDVDAVRWGYHHGSSYPGVTGFFDLNAQITDETTGKSSYLSFVLLSADKSGSSTGCNWHATVTPAS